jgi:hypothetical protein
MLTLIRRFLVLAALMFWQGGFTFYSAVVIHIGADVLGSHLPQGFITRYVAMWLNVAGAITLPLLAWDTAVSSDRNRWRRRLRWALWGVLLVTLAALVPLHGRVDSALDAERMRILDRPSFEVEHQRYLFVATAQWAAALVALAASLAAWRAEDR